MNTLLWTSAVLFVLAQLCTLVGSCLTMQVDTRCRERGGLIVSGECVRLERLPVGAP